MNPRPHHHCDKECSPEQQPQRQPGQPVEAGMPRLLAEGSKFGFDSTGCPFPLRAIFEAYMGDMSDLERDVVDLHRIKCAKCRETLAAFRSEMEERMVRRALQRHRSRERQAEGDFMTILHRLLISQPGERDGSDASRRRRPAHRHVLSRSKKMHRTGAAVRSRAL